MNIIPLPLLQSDPSVILSLAKTLKDEKVVCFPSGSSYRLAVDLLSPDAVAGLVRLKHRTKNAPALVFIPDVKTLGLVAAAVPKPVEKVMAEFWPGPLTLLFDPAESLDPKVRKIVAKAHGQVGVRVPEHEVSLAVVKAFGGPVLVSSANLASKHGAGSVAQVKKSFGRFLDVLVDGGDLPQGPQSTVAEVTDQGLRMVREGAITADQITKTLGANS